MKNKYQRMSKEKKKECQKLYYQTLKGKDMRIRLTRLTLTGIIGILFSFYIIFNSYKENTLTWGFWVISIVLFIASIVFIVASRLLKIKCLNEYAVKNMK